MSVSELARRNQAILAEKLHWPDGALETCNKLEDANPGWHVAWLPENTFEGFERPAGFWAVYDGWHKVEILRADPVALAERMAEVPPEHDFSVTGCDWCRAHPPPYVGGRRVRI